MGKKFMVHFLLKAQQKKWLAKKSMIQYTLQGNGICKIGVSQPIGGKTRVKARYYKFSYSKFTNL